eukprot:759001-Hanusia_phi.AAC.4
MHTFCIDCSNVCPAMDKKFDSVFAATGCSCVERGISFLVAGVDIRTIIEQEFYGLESTSSEFL